MIRALLIDLDNTIYPVSSIADHLFGKLFEVIDNSNEDISENAKKELMRRPFHLVAEQFNFSPELTEKGTTLLRNLTYDLPMQPFDGYQYIKTLNVDKFLVTTGFTKLQWSKVNMLGIEKDFKSIHVIDPDTSGKTKKDIFAEIMEKYGYKTEELLAVGDDPESEIKAASDLGIKTFLFDPENRYPTSITTYKAKKLEALVELL